MATLSLIPAYTPATLVICITLCLLLYAGYSIHSYARLSHIPGPFLAAWSNLPRMYWVWTRSSHLIHVDLHKKYGKLVRLGPNSISCGDPAEIPTIYGFNGKWIKVQWLDPFAQSLCRISLTFDVTSRISIGPSCPSTKAKSHP